MASTSPICPKCMNKGLIQIRYRDGGSPDIAICDCRQGRGLRHFTDDTLRDMVAIPSDYRIANLEDFDDEKKPSFDVTDAARRPLKQRL